MGHVVLLGDSVFDNVRYVPGGPPVIKQMGKALPPGWCATLLAVDGQSTGHVAAQLQRLPADATHLVVSAGGNDALGASGILSRAVRTVGEALHLMGDVRARFRDSYHGMLQALAAVGKPTAVCTVYDAIPGLGAAEQTALVGFNEVILREAFASGFPVIDLRLVCDQPSDYSRVSPIEPSVEGGDKIVRAITEVVTTHDYGRRRSVVYTGDGQRWRA
jgi:hypothetical protein